MKSESRSLAKKGNPKQCNNYHTMSLISHPSKVPLRIILNRLEPQAKIIIAEGQAGFRKTGAQWNRYLSPESLEKYISNIKENCTRYSSTSKKLLTGCGTRHYAAQ